MVRLHAILFGVAAAVVIQSNVNQKINDDDQIYANLSSVASTEVVQFLDEFADTLLDPAADGASDVAQAMRTVSSKMDLRTASHLLDVKSIPQDVTHLVQTVSDGDSVSQFDENSLDKARVALNDMVYKAWLELDDTIFKCKGFEDMNRETHSQVSRDIQRLMSQIDDLKRLEAEAQNGISMTTQQITELQEALENLEEEYKREHAINEEDLRIKQNDLDVFQFILEFTKCKDATSLTQTKAQVCETRSGRKTILFGDAETASKYRKFLTPGTKKSIDMILRSVETEHSSFLQQPNANASSTFPPQTEQEPVLGEDAKPCLPQGNGGGGADECMKSCTAEPPDCALLHDKLSLMWGEYKDKVDELTMLMRKLQAEYEENSYNLNQQIMLLTGKLGTLNEHLAEVSSKLKGDRLELSEKEVQSRHLNQQYSKGMRQCKKRIQWIMYQDMCAIKVVRNAVLVNSTKCRSDTIQDCVLNSWVKGGCSVPCDDTCESNKPFECGGWAPMEREIITQPDDCGIKCPSQWKNIRCGQYKCPVNCQMSAWSGWSECTAECGGGERTSTRSIITKPRHGGNQCLAVQQMETCGGESCDRNCWLNKWTDWSPCSVACGGGFQERQRHVLIPIRGAGMCPTPQSKQRYGNKQCNTGPCVGDEICVAKQDLVVAVDGSGSLTADGFKVLKQYTKVLLKRYSNEYWGQPTMRVGLVLFGNGVIMPDGKTVSPARLQHKLSGDLDSVRLAVDGLPYKKGFTNMAQALTMAENLFNLGGRKDAQQSVMLITDGKPSFAFMTNEMVEQLDDKNIMRYFVVVNSDGPNSDVMKQMKHWASAPWETNLIHVPGLIMLEADMDLWAERALTKFCPEAYSPSFAAHEEKQLGYAHVKDSAWCGGRGYILSTTANSAESCAALAQGAGCSDFIMGTFFRRGWCYCGDMKVDTAQYKDWQEHKINPECPTGWKSSMLYDFWMIEPVNR